MLRYSAHPRTQALPAYNSFSSMEAFPSLEALGVRNGQDGRSGRSSQLRFEVEMLVLGGRKSF